MCSSTKTNEVEKKELIAIMELDECKSLDFVYQNKLLTVGASNWREEIHKVIKVLRKAFWIFSPFFNGQ